MRYRLLSYRYALTVRPGHSWPSGDIWQSGRVRVLVQAPWRPDTDVYETPTTLEITVDLAGLDEDEFEMKLFEDALVVEGQRRLPACQAEATYHAAGIRQGPFRVEVPLPAAVDPERVEAHYEHGLLRVTLAKRGAR